MKKLTAEKAASIKFILELDEYFKEEEIISNFRTTKTALYNIKINRNWKDIEPELSDEGRIILNKLRGIEEKPIKRKARIVVINRLK